MQASAPVRVLHRAALPAFRGRSVVGSRAIGHRLMATGSSQGVTKEIVKEGSGAQPKQGEKVRRGWGSVRLQPGSCLTQMW